MPYRHGLVRSSVPFAWLAAATCASALQGRIPIHKISGNLVHKIRLYTSPVGELSLSSNNDFAYLIKVDIGGQDFMVILDTGSSDLWVISSDCTSAECNGVPKYNKSSSLSLTDVPFQLDYLIGNVTGIVGSDTVTVGDFQVTSQVFAMANETDGLGLSATGNSGILGLAFPAEAAIPETTGRTLAENLFSGLSDDADRYFAFRLGRDDSDSSFTIGELDPTYANSTGDLTLHPVLPTQGAIYDYWKLPFQSLTINGTAFELSKSRIEGASTPIAVLDSGTTLMLGPSGDVARFWESVGGARETNRGWEVPCNRAVAVGLVLGDGNKREEYAVDPADISWTEGSVQSTSWCLGGVQANDGVYSADWLLGDTFLRNVYVTHHAAAGSQPPAIGLRSLTDPAAALAAFVESRGPDALPPARVLSHPPSSHSLTSGGICGIATACGFIAGAVFAALALFYTPRRKKY